MPAQSINRNRFSRTPSLREHATSPFERFNFYTTIRRLKTRYYTYYFCYLFYYFTVFAPVARKLHPITVIITHSSRHAPAAATIFTKNIKSKATALPPNKNQQGLRPRIIAIFRITGRIFKIRAEYQNLQYSQN